MEIGELRADRTMLRGPARRLLAVLLTLSAGAMFAQETIHFIGLDGSGEADRKLRLYLQDPTLKVADLKNPQLQFQTHTVAYDAAVRMLAEEKGREGRYLAHMTPFALVAAEMLGANFEILATYNSKAITESEANGVNQATPATIYSSYFVVNRKDIENVLKPKKFEPAPSLADLSDYLRKRPKPAMFVYHDKFSTSSFLLPSLYFREQHVFDVHESGRGTLVPIHVERAPMGEGTDYLIQQVALGGTGGGADLAAVWDKPKEAADKRAKDQVFFIELPTRIPNDLLVLSRKPGKVSDDYTRTWILGAIRATTRKTDWRPKEKDANLEKKVAEFQWWVDLTNPSEEGVVEALDALGTLRRLASERPHYVTVEIDEPQDAGQAVRDKWLRALKRGIELSGTEFVLFDRSFHKKSDVKWTPEFIHDGAINLTSEIQNVKLDPQHFTVSFKDPADLTTRITELLQSRVHRIRYVWPYVDNFPAVIRDLDFVPEKTVKVHRIAWTDPERNDYEEGMLFEATIENLATAANDYKLQLGEGLFPRGPAGGYQFEPLSNVAYKVILQRSSSQALWFAYLTGLFLALLVFAAVACAWELRRRRPAPVGFAQSYERLAQARHRPWRDREIQDADVLWSDPKLDEFIRFFQGKSLFDELGNEKPIPGVPISLGALRQLLRRTLGETFKLAPELASTTEVGGTEALSRLIKFLVRDRRLSSFTGKPLEWDALEDIIRRDFRKLGIWQRDTGARLQRDGALSDLVSRHFQDVLEKGTTASFFEVQWQLEQSDDGYRLAHNEALNGELRIMLKGGTVLSRNLLLEFTLPPDLQFRENLAAVGNTAWLLGKITERTRVGQNGAGEIRVRFKPYAVLKPLVVAEPAKPMALAVAAGAS